MLENNKILHISGYRHQLIDDILFYRQNKKEKKDNILIGNKKLFKFNKFNKFNILLFHFINNLDINYINKIININLGKKIGLYLHTFFPFSEDGTFLGKRLTQDRLFWIFINKLDFIIVQDKYSFNLISKSILINKKCKIILLKQPVNLSKVLYKDKIKNNRFSLGFIGNFSYIKGFDLIFNLIRDFSMIFNKLEIDIFLYTIEKPGIKIGKKKIRKLRDNIFIIYNEHNRKNIYKNINCLMIPSIWNETGPMVLYEALANRIPVIISNQESLKEKVLNRKDSYIFKTGDERDLLKGILWVKKNYKKVIAENKGFNYNTIERFNLALEKFLNKL